MAVATETKCWMMARKPIGLPTYSGESPTFVLETRSLPDLKSGQVLVEALYLSNDPAQRTWMSLDLPEERHYGKALTSALSNPETSNVTDRKGTGIHERTASNELASHNPSLRSSDKKSTNIKTLVSSIQAGSVVKGRGIVKILQSTSQQFKEGQFGYSPVGWP